MRDRSSISGQFANLRKFAIPTLLVLGLVHACVPRVPQPAPVPGAGCIDACAALERLGCAGATGSPGPDDVPGTHDDVACIDACALLEAEGIIVLHTECVAGAHTCEQADACSRVGP